jgi:predicted dehydrogenase/nucleoside-diphosphate-sugar epimerase
VRVAITGVTGFIGKRLATRALEAGHDVTGFSRRAWTGEPYVPLDDRYFLELPARPEAAALDGADALIHLAVAPEDANQVATDAVNRLGTQRLFETVVRAGVGRFVFISSQSAHADAASAYGQSKHAVEEALADDARVVIVRPGMVYGDTDEGLVGRAARVAAKLRVFPVIGGRAARVQPIHVDELCDALLALAAMVDPPRVVELADPEVRRLDEFLRKEVKRRYGVTPIGVPVPLGPVRVGVGVLSRLRLPSPITRKNLDGIEAFRAMDTADDLERVGLSPESRSAARPGGQAVAAVEPRRVLLVGAGRIGLVHAITAAHHQRMIPVALVDLDRAAMGRVAAFAGSAIPAYTDLVEAVQAVAPDAAIIATPPSSHVRLAEKLLAAGIDVLVEKPVAASDDDRRALATAAQTYNGRYLSTGYLYGLLPHVAAIAPDLRSGRFGSPQSFEGHAFVSRVEEGAAEKRDMWELDPTISGGGALVNLGVHVLAMLDFLLGPADVEGAVLVSSAGRASEDGAALTLRAGGVVGTFSTAWHLPDFDMSENELRIVTDRGVVVCTTSCAAFIGDAEVHLVHQLDADAGFDLAPMDAGGAFWSEQDLLARREPGPNSLALAGRVEDLITHVYRTAERVEPPSFSDSSVVPPATPATTAVFPDLRAAPAGVERGWNGPKLTGSTAVARSDSMIALPDAPGHFRTLTNKGALTLVRDLGPSRLARGALGLSPAGAASKTGRPWEALLVLMRAELRRLSRSYDGTLILDAYLVDLATATRNIAVIASALDDLHSYCPKARVGLEVNASSRLVPHVPELAAQLDLVIAICTLDPANVAPLREMLPASTELVAKTGVLPSELLQIAWDDPDRWTEGNGRLMVHWPGAPALRDVDTQRIAHAKHASGINAIP